jgi:hypothetical protein
MATYFQVIDGENYDTVSGIATDADVDFEIAECFAEDAGLVHNEGWITTHCNADCDLLCERHPAGRLSRNDYVNYGI